MAVLKRKVPDEILHSIVGSHISQFCGIFKARWLIIYESESMYNPFLTQMDSQLLC